MAPSGIVGRISGEIGDLLIWRILVEPAWRLWRDADVASDDLDRPNFRCCFIDTDVDFAPKAFLLAARLADDSLAFSRSLDTSRVNEQVQHPRARVTGIADVQRLLSPEQRT
ncbi:MAG: hypothetical protein F4Y60_13875 [Boseongicola sp. SB0664_bin_43]|uniref:Uncharacterized protein n=1 Tax=Boseongicola sp. SB0664_bin_43 TaxID=2604844 RepID=A0A6B0Y2Y9_9RHOB|nr:hypothetical protein [Boseongicola sp. SB0664_bin_43]MYK31290.1 hypothetical protein [Boseongicola sp. SB0670_bin_30]